MRSKTVLDHVRPTVVVRRRIYDPSQFHDAPAVEAAPEPPVLAEAIVAPPPVERAAERTTGHHFLPTQSWGAADEDENGPPSSVNVARALASLRSDELQRVEDLLRAQDEEDEEPPTSSVVAPPASLAPLSFAPGSLAPLSTAHVQPRVVRLPPEIALVDLAEQMNVAPEELVTTLVTGGFFTVARTSMLPRGTARLGAEMFGWHPVDMSADEEAAYAAAHPRAKKAPARKKSAAKRK